MYSVTPALGHRHGNLTSVYSVTPSLAKQSHFNITRPAATASYITAATPHLAPYRPDEGSLASQPTRHSLVTTRTRATPHFSIFFVSLQVILFLHAFRPPTGTPAPIFPFDVSHLVPPTSWSRPWRSSANLFTRGHPHVVSQIGAIPLTTICKDHVSRPGSSRHVPPDTSYIPPLHK